MRYLLPLIVFFLACTEEPKAPEKIELPTLVHTVKFQGETLSIIAAWYTGNGSLWKIISEANPTLSPNNLHRGEKVRIPRTLLSRQNPLPQRFIFDFYKRMQRNSEQQIQEQVSPDTTPTPEAAIEIQTDPNAEHLKEQTREELLRELGIE